MRVLVACEFSGIVREAFAKRGHDAWSCDLLPTEIPGKHIQGDILGVIRGIAAKYWDIMIAFPPCTYLCGAGLNWINRQPGRREKIKEALNFVIALVNAPIPKIAIENPVGLLSTLFRKPDQYIQPYYFGDKFQKKTCLWVKNLPLLIPTNIVDRGEIYIQKNGKSRGGKWTMGIPGNSPDKWKIRSRTFQGIANAMAEQWG